jgi:transcription factor E
MVVLMPRQQMKKKSQKKVKKSSKKTPSKPKAMPKKKLKKSIARKAIRKAVAKRVKKKVVKKTAKKKAVRKKVAKKAVKKKTARKMAAGRKVTKKKLVKKKMIKKKITKKKLVKNAAKIAKASKPKIKEKKAKAPPAPEKLLNRAEIRKLLSDSYARHLIIESGGEHALEIVRGFSNNSSDEDMCKKLKIKISDVRATLNKLHSLGIVDYTRHKDSETGWFSYFWCLNVDKMKGWVNERIDEERRNQDFSRGEYYFCPSCGGASIHEFVSASDFGFKCPTCSSALDFLSEDKAEELFPTKAFRKPHL